ncbi:DUF3467 domain-containing protein [Candidatus Dojkabacteria bacterium]|nr:DUF3467 domain-containing protein [Candidatus Dojkabacteria bacterium]
MADAKKLKINVSPDKIEAKYSDFAIIAKSALGFNFDFAQRIPGGNQVNIVSRIGMSPQHAKLFFKVLERNLEQYEKQYGEIKVPEGVKRSKEDNSIIHFVK